MVVNAPESGYADLVFGLQWSWTEPEERGEQLQVLSDCVSRRLDQGTIKRAQFELSPRRRRPRRRAASAGVSAGDEIVAGLDCNTFDLI